MRQTPASIRGATAPLQALSQVWSTSAEAFRHNPKWLVSFEDNTQFGSRCEDTTQNGSFPRTGPKSTSALRAHL